MFEQFLRKDEHSEEIASEKRQMEFGRSQTLVGSAVQPEDDTTYINTQDKKSDLIRWQQELDSEMYELILSFLSMRRTLEGKVEHIYDEKNEEIPPICNRLFIYQVVLPKLRPFMTKNLINSNLDTKQILTMQKLTADDIADMVADNYEKYGIDFVNFDGIIRDIKNTIKASVWRAFKGWTKKTDSSMIKRIESENYAKQEEEKGVKKIFAT